MARTLFLDNHDIEDMAGLRRVVNQPIHYHGNPVLRPERPWEQGSISHYGTLLYDTEQKLFRLWYLASPKHKKSMQLDGRSVPGNWSLLCYATSGDAIHWERPNLRQVDFEGSRDNNIIRIGSGKVEGVGIIHEPDDPDPDRRYKAIYWNQDGPIITQPDGALDIGRNDNPHDGMWVSFSPDGLHWSDYQGNPIYCGSDTSHYVVKNSDTGKYLAYGRFNGLKFGNEWQRRVACIESSDFMEWSRGVVVMEADHFDEQPMPETQIYGMTVDQYEGLYLGGVWMYHRGGDHTMDTQLAVSRDGICWSRVGDNDFHRRPLGRDPIPEDIDRQPFLALGSAGSGYAGMIRPAAKFITINDTIYILVGLVEQQHCDLERNFQPRKTNVDNTLGLVTLRRDGFVSLDTCKKGGYLVSKPFTFSGHALHLNADATKGTVKAKLLDADTGELIARSAVITGNKTDMIMAWEKTPASAGGRSVKLQLLCTNCKLYSYWFAN